MASPLKKAQVETRPYCSACKHDLRCCDRCKKPLWEGDVVYCDKEAGKHFCTACQEPKPARPVRLCKIELVCGIYEDEGRRVFQVAEDIEHLSSQLLDRQFGPDPVIQVGFATVKLMIPGLLDLARTARCALLEFNCKKGHGGYRLIKVRG
jgi:hypothetical protein